MTAQNDFITDNWSTWPMYPVNSDRYKKAGLPLFVWQKEFESSPQKYLDFCRKVSDALLFTGNSVFDETYVNRPHLAQIARGKIREADYWEADYVYGQKSFIPIRDNHFFEGAKNSMLGDIVSQPFKFITKNINNDYAKKQVRKVSENAAKAVLNVAAQNMAKQGIGAVGQIPFPKVNIKGDIDSVLSRLNPQESVDYIVFALLKSVDFKHSFLDISKKCFDNAFDINARFAGVFVRYGEVVPMHLNPAQMRWLSTGPIETFEDDGVMACSYHEYVTIEDILAEEGSNLFKAFGVAGLKSALSKIQEGKPWGYNPNLPYEFYYGMDSGTTLEASNLQRQEYFEDERQISQQINWSGANPFYPDMYLGGMRRAGTLRHTFYFKMIRDHRMLILVDGKNTTKQQFLDKVRYDFDRKHTVEFRKVPTDYKPQKGEYVVDIPVRELHQGRRIGHSVLIDCGLYEHQQPKGLKPNFPLVAKIVNEKSYVRLGEEMCKRVNLIFQRIDEMIVQMGHSTAILIDEAQETDYVGFLYNARRTGIALYNSNKMTGGNKASMRHLQPISLGTQIDELEKLFAMAGVYQMSYNNMVGASAQVQGVYQKYSGLQQTQMNIQNQGVLKQRSFTDHTKFMNDLLQRTGDVLKSHYAGEDEVSVSLGKDKQATLKLSKDMSLAEIDIYLESGYDLAAKKQRLDDAASRVLSGAGIDFFEPLLEILETDNVAEARALWRDTLPLIKQQEQTNSERNAQAMERQAQAIADKTRVILDREDMITQREIRLQEMQLAAKDKELDAKDQSQVEDEVGKREQMILQSVLNEGKGGSGQ